MDVQDSCLEEAISTVQEQAFYMKRAIDNDNMREALKHASNLIGELCTSSLLPKSYHELYMQVFQEMQYLATCFSNKSRHKHKMSDLYGSVQSAGSILPRLYLLATVGGSYIKSKEAPAKEVLTDLSELCKGVQDPMRGLFLRYFLSQMVKDKLPDTGSEYEKVGGGDIADAFAFVFANLVESNRFWVRMQHQGPIEDRGRHEKQRHDLRVLVGSNLDRLSQLDGMTVKFYAEVALPRILEHVLAVKDITSQLYLLESVIQIFPDVYHVQTLEELFVAFSKALPAVDMRSILSTLMKCLVPCLTNDACVLPGGLSRTGVLALFGSHMQAIIERRLESVAKGTFATLDIAICLELQTEFITFAHTLYPDDILYVDSALSSIIEISKMYFLIEGEGTSNGAKRVSSATSKKIVDFINSALQPFLFKVLESSYYPALLSLLSFHARKEVAMSIVRLVVSESIELHSADTLTKLFNVITPLVKDEDDTPAHYGSSGREFANEQEEVCKLLYRIRADSLELEYEMLNIIRDCFCQGGVPRLVHTLPPTANAIVALLQKFGAREKKRQEMLDAGQELPPSTSLTAKKICQLIHKTITALVKYAPDIALQLWLSTASVVDRLHQSGSGSLEPICYEFMSQGMICFEEHITDNKKQYEGIFQLVGVLSNLTCLEAENRDTISGRIVSYAARLLMKPLQCRAISICAQMFWNDAQKDGTKVLECLQKSLKICESVVQQDAKNVGLWVEMLDKYIFYYEKDCDEVNIKFIESLICLCLEHISFATSMDDFKVESREAAQHLKDSVHYLTRVKSDGIRQIVRFQGFNDENLLQKVDDL